MPYRRYPAPEPSDHFSTWTRVTSLARARDGAVEEEDFRTAADLQAVMEDLNRMDEGDLEEKARRIEALVRADLPEDYDAAALLKAELEEKVQRWRPPAVRRACLMHLDEFRVSFFSFLHH